MRLSCDCTQVREIILDAIGDGGWYRLAFLIVAAVWLLWLMFLLNFLVGNLRMLFGPVAQVRLSVWPRLQLHVCTPACNKGSSPCIFEHCTVVHLVEILFRDEKHVYHDKCASLEGCVMD